jgi:hypothetical protein
MDEAATETLTERELRWLREECAMLTRGGIIEVAVRNPNVAEYMRHWEGRAEKAEAALLSERNRTIAECAGIAEAKLKSLLSNWPDANAYECGHQIVDAVRHLK